MKRTYLPVGLQAATLLTAGLFIGSVAGAAQLPTHAATPVSFLVGATLTTRPGRETSLLEPRPGFGPRTAIVAPLWRVDDQRDREDEGHDRYQGNIGDRGNYGNYGARGNYGNYGDRGLRGDRGNTGDRRDGGENRDH